MKNETFPLLFKFNKIESNHWWWQGRRYLLSYILGDSPNGTLLDVGSGTGETILYLKKRYKNLYPLIGIDSSKLAVKYSKKRGISNVILSTIEKASFKNESLDFILYLDVIEHLPYDLAIIKKSTKWLKRGGKIIIMSPAMPILWSDHDKNQGHYRRYTKEMVEILAKEARVEIEFLSYFNVFLSPIIFLIRIIGKIPIFRFIVAYDNGLNYGVARYPFINTFLAKLFQFEISLLRYGIRYPFGISLCTVLKKV